MVELKALGGYERLKSRHPTVKVSPLGDNCHKDCLDNRCIQVWGLISEDILTLAGEVTD